MKRAQGKGVGSGAKQQQRALVGENAHEEKASADYPKAVFTGEEECYTPPELLDAARDALTWDKWPECEAMSRPTGAERLTLAAATQRHAPKHGSPWKALTRAETPT